MFFKKRTWNFAVLLISIVVTGTFLYFHKIVLLYKLVNLYMIFGSLVGGGLFVYLGIKLQFKVRQEGKRLRWYQNLYILLGLAIALIPSSTIRILWDDNFLQPKGILLFDISMNIVEYLFLTSLIFIEIVFSINFIRFLMGRQIEV